MEDGQKVYEISFRKDGHKIDVLYSQDGVVIEIAESIASGKLPRAIRNQLNAKFGKYEIEESEKINKDSGIFYEVELMVKSAGENQKYEILFSEDAQIIEQEKGDEDEEQ